jgi:transposase
MSERKTYPSDVNEEEWAILEPLVPAVKTGGRPARYSRREIMNAILYVLRTGCSWRMLPHDLPPWDTAYGYFNRWRKDGTWETIHRHLYGQLREQLGRETQPSAAIMDSQSVKTTEKGARGGTTLTRKSEDANATF